MKPADSQAAFKKVLNSLYWRYTAGFLLFTFLLALLEQMGLPRRWVGLAFLLATIAIYAGIGILSRTTDDAEYYVAGRRVPALYNGMATGSDWMSAASFISLAGTLYLTGYDGLAFVMGWTGGYCLVALLLAPYLRRFGQFTIPDFLGARYGGHLPRLVGVGATLLCSFIYVVAQIYGVGLITSRLTGIAFELGIFLGLGGILLCSFLGGMRAVTWTQVAQYIIIAIAYLLPVFWLSVKQTGNPLPQIGYGFQLQAITRMERQLIDDPNEQEVRALHALYAQELSRKLDNPRVAIEADRIEAQRRLADLKAADVPAAHIAMAERALASLPRDELTARRSWLAAREMSEQKSRPLSGLSPHAALFGSVVEGDSSSVEAFDIARRNFLALVFCLVVGTAGLPHILMRYYTTPTVQEARRSVTWSLAFILVVYLTAPALAVLVKYEVFHVLVGMPFDQLPSWILAWTRVDPTLLAVTDLNRDNVLQLGEITLGGDIIVLATPEIAGLPYVISGLVAAGGLAAALSTADGLLLTIANALSHDVYYKMIDPLASTARRVTLSKVLLLIVALAAAYLAAQRPADILFLVSAAFSLAAATLFPALVLGIFWKRTTGTAAVLGMLSGLLITGAYMVMNQPGLRAIFGVTVPMNLWWGIRPISAGIFGVPVAFAVMIMVSWISPRSDPGASTFVDWIRQPEPVFPREP
jgi:cation/acetate symporter